MESKPEHLRAREWREANGYTRAHLSALIGYSVSMIRDYESGAVRGTGKTIGENEWRRYRLACGAIEHAISFDWET